MISKENFNIEKLGSAHLLLKDLQNNLFRANFKKLFECNEMC